MKSTAPSRILQGTEPETETLANQKKKITGHYPFSQLLGNGMGLSTERDQTENVCTGMPEPLLWGSGMDLGSSPLFKPK